MKRVLTFTLLLLIAAPSAALGVEVSASVDRTSIASRDTLQLSVSINGDDGRVDVSPIRDFRVISRGSSTSVQIVNDSVTRQVVYNYTLVPLKKGSLSIPALPVVAGGAKLVTEPITIVVGDGPKEENKTPDVDVRAETSEYEPYEGQQIIYTFRLLSAVPIANVRFQPPSFEGFSARQIDDQRSYKKVVSGREHHVNEVFFVLTPLKTGTLTIEPALLSCDVLVEGRRKRSFPFDGMFNDPFFDRRERRRKLLKSDSVSLNVRPLPPYTGDGEFSGLVGQFNIRAELEKDTLQAGDSTTLSVAISGAGNVMDARLPEFDVPQGLKVYKDAPEEKISVGDKGYTGEKIFKTALAPTEPGSFNLGSIVLNFFDPSGGVYRKAMTRPLALDVEPSESKEKMETAAATPVSGQEGKKEVEFTGRDILPLKESLDALQPAGTVALPEFAAFVLVPPCLYLLLLAVFRLAGKKDGPGAVMSRRAGRALRLAEDPKKDPRQRLQALYRALVSAVLAKGGKTGESLTGDETETILVESGVGPETARKAANLLAKIESARYGRTVNDSESVDMLVKESSGMVGGLLKK